jgi:hypothetical protein
MVEGWIGAGAAVCAVSSGCRARWTTVAPMQGNWVAESGLALGVVQRLQHRRCCTIASETARYQRERAQRAMVEGLRMLQDRRRNLTRSATPPMTCAFARAGAHDLRTSTREALHCTTAALR